MRPTIANFLLVLVCTRDLAAQTPSAAAVPFAVLDNSFLVEEAFNQEPGVAVSSTEDRDLFSPQIAASAIWRLRPMLHLMVEGVGLFQQSVDESTAVTRDTVVTISPGLRQGWNVGKTQFVIGAAVPITS